MGTREKSHIPGVSMSMRLLRLFPNIRGVLPYLLAVPRKNNDEVTNSPANGK